MLIREFSPEWKLWIWQNVVNGIPKESIFNVLLNYGFEYSLVQKELEHDPVHPLIWKRQYSQENMGDFGKETILPLHKRLCDNPQIFRVDTNRVELYHLPEFLMPDDCRKLIDDTTEFDGLNETLHKVVGVDLSLSGDLFVDETDSESLNLERVVDDAEWEMIIFLNDVKDGGEIKFPNINKIFTPTRGDALVWRKLYPSGQPNPDAIKEENPMESDVRYTLHKFFKRPELMAQVINVNMDV